MKQRISWLFTASLVATDALMAGLAFSAAEAAPHFVGRIDTSYVATVLS